ncbi:uncharacterized protein LOC112679949 [Sipha flava]|uniref:Uncharacterized protein LOC112679949 n=1 Tax=Sipha flava TaxID=143950 RepID=A0A8B8F5S3_9HEMI|nr:uncharacterized protein LOC112679949 [Sipha flava]
MRENGLRLAPEKSECVVLTSKHAYSLPQLHIEGFQVPTKRAIRYLGVQLDTRLSFVEHVTTVAAGARRAAAAIGRLMPNVRGPSQSKRSLLMSVVHSRLLYGAQVWADRVQGVAKARESLSMAQRTAALRVARCYRTVSDVAAQVLARMPPAFLLALERKRVGESRKMGVHLSKSAAREETIRQWQVHWDSTSKGAWTKRLIQMVALWTEVVDFQHDAGPYQPWLLSEVPTLKAESPAATVRTL